MTTHRDLTTPELRPCPFCGAAPTVTLWEDAISIACSSSHERCPANPDVSGYDRDAAIAAWNRRPRTFTAAEVAEAMRGWNDAYAAFVGAFDTPAARRRQSDEYANDARDRLREFNERITHWLRENEG
jgi:hypothetical protein